MGGLPPLPPGADTGLPPLPPGADPIAQQGAQVVIPPQAEINSAVASAATRWGVDPHLIMGEYITEGAERAKKPFGLLSGTRGYSGIGYVGQNDSFAEYANVNAAWWASDKRAMQRKGLTVTPESLIRYHMIDSGYTPLPNESPGKIKNMMSFLAANGGGMSHADTTTPTNRVPLPIPHVEGKNRPRNEDPRNGNYNLMESAAGHQELPFMLANAKLWDDLDKTGGTHVAEVLNLWIPRAFGGQGKPGGASAMYGTNSPRVLEMYARSGNPMLQAYAAALKSNSHIAGTATFVEEWFNPMGWAEGGLIGKGMGKVVLPGLMKIPGVGDAVNNIIRSMSIYKGIVKAHGEGPRNVLHTIGQRMSREATKGHTAMMDVFAGHSAPEQEEIVRRQQLLHPNADAFSPERNALIDAAAKRKRDMTREKTAARIATGALKKSQVKGVRGSAPTTLYHNGKKVADFPFDPGTYHGLKDQYSHPNDGYNALLEELASQGRGPAKGGGVPSIKRATYDNIDEAKAGKDGVSLLKGDIDHADLFRNFMITSGKRVAFEEGMRELAQRHPDVITVPTSTAQRDALLQHGKYIPISDSRHSGIAIFGDRGSSFMKNALISPALRDFFGDRNSLAATLGSSIFENGPQSQAGKFVSGLNSAYRATIVANPGYHPFWNVAPNAAAATGKTGPAGLSQLLLNNTRALLGAGASVSHALGLIPVAGGLAKPITRTLDAVREGLEHPFLKNAQSYQDALHAALNAGLSPIEEVLAGKNWETSFAKNAAREEALHAGAGAEFGAPRPPWGGSPGRIYTRPLKDPATGKYTPVSSLERLEHMVARMDNWNREGTFGHRGEQAFATVLFHQLHNKGGMFEGDPYAAAWAVREALGNYRNMNPDNWMSKAILFFPWLASNVPFWFRAFTKTPQFITAPTQGSRTQRENAGDPTAYDAGHPKMGISLYDSASGQSRSVPFPFKDAERIAQAGYDTATGDPQTGIQLVESEFAARAKPLIGVALNTILTTADERANPAGTYVGYDVMYDKNLPDQRLADWSKSAGLEVMPMPAPFVMRDIARHGYDPSKMSDYIQEALGMGYITDRTADNFKKVANAASTKLETSMAKARKIQAGRTPMTEDQLKAYQQRAEKVYRERMQHIQDIIDASKQKSSGLPPLPSGADSLPVLPAGAK